MSKFLLRIILPLVIFSMSSCFDVIEEVTINDDGTGTVTYTLDMSGMKSMIDALQNIKDSTDNVKDMDLDVQKEQSEGDKELQTSLNETSEDFDELVVSLGGIAGITNAMNTSDPKAYVYKITFDFANVDALNQAMRKLLHDDNPEAEPLYAIKKKKIYRRNHVDKKVTDQLGDDTDESSMRMAKMFFSDAHYIVKLNFQRTVKSVKGDGAFISASNCVTNKIKLVDLMDSKATTETQVKLKRK